MNAVEHLIKVLAAELPTLTLESVTTINKHAGS